MTPGRRQWLVPALIFAVCAAPFLAGLALYASGWRPAAVKPSGELVQPATVTGSVRGRWNLIYFAPRDCDAACETVLGRLRNVQAAQGKERERVLRVIAAPDAPSAQAYGARLGGEADVAVRVMSGSGIILADPEGRAVLHYADSADPGGMRRDLARLLRYSWIG